MTFKEKTVRGMFVLRKTLLYLLVYTSFLYINTAVYGQDSGLLINEFMADNSTTIQDAKGDYSDWIELFNNTESPVNLAGYTITDDPDDIGQWEFPDLILQPDEYLIIFASGDDQVNLQGELHTNFALSKNGEFIGLYDEKNQVTDSLSFGEQVTDYSFGRKVNETQNWVFFSEPSPGAQNNSAGVQFAEDPEFSNAGGFYEPPLTLTLSVQNNEARIYYTLDGSAPDEQSELYDESIQLAENTPVRARTFVDGKEPSDIITHTYFVNEEVHLPYISLVTDPGHFFSDETGIYVTGTNGAEGSCQKYPLRNLNQDWERPVHIELYEEDGEIALNQNTGVKIFGGCSRTRYPQKSLAFFARSEYGEGDFNYQLFPDKENESYEAFILRGSGDDQVHTMFRDAFTQYSQVDFMDIDYQAYRPVVVFINGDYWGIHNLREKMNEHYLADNHGVDPETVHILENNAQVVQGDANHYNRLVNFVSVNDMNETDKYSYVSSQMDIGQYIDYQIANIYLGENDWPGNNIKFWRGNDEDSKWRWLTFDKDQSYQEYQLEVNSLDRATAAGGTVWPNPDWSTKLFRNLLESDEFRHRFIQSYAYHMNVTFHPERISSLLNEFKNHIASEIPRHIERWGGQLDPDNQESWVPPTFSSFEEWEQKVEVIRSFSEDRPEIAKNHLMEMFGLSDLEKVSVELNEENMGRVYLYNYPLDKNTSEGNYYKNISIQLSAEPREGYRFVRWLIESAGETSTSRFDTISITPESNLQVTAVFEHVNETSNPPIIINEINYHSPEGQDSGDWLEIYNRHDTKVDVSGWYLKDSNEENEFFIPENTSLEPGEFLVLVHDEEDFINVFPEVTNYAGSFSFNLSNGGELVRLYSSEGELVNQVEYDDEGEWPAQPDGNGSTLELKNYDLDNSLPASWGASVEFGTPGRQNSILVSNEPNKQVDDFRLHQNYPNPFNPETTIPYQIEKAGQVELEVYDVLGQKVSTLINKPQAKGMYLVSFNAEALSSGVYILHLSVDGRVQTKKMLLLK